MPHHLGGIGMAALHIRPYRNGEKLFFPGERAEITAATFTHCPDGIKL